LIVEYVWSLHESGPASSVDPPAPVAVVASEPPAPPLPLALDDEALLLVALDVGVATLEQAENTTAERVTRAGTASHRGEAMSRTYHERAAERPAGVTRG
jgi:hypothetical protein